MDPVASAGRPHRRGSRVANHAHPVLERAGISLRPSTDSDLDLLAGWFATSDVYRWWGGRPLGRSEVAAKYTGRRCPRVESFLVQLNNEPIGYIHYHFEGPADVGLDMFLLPAFRGRGLGPRAARLLIDYLRGDLGVTDIAVDPDRDNARAVRAWQKAGFTVVVETADESTLLLTLPAAS